MNKTVIILGSARRKGDTRAVVDKLIVKTKWDLIDLNNYNFSYYDYEHKNRGDDFLGLIKDLIKKYDTFIFATPVYWYAMSGIMKVFIDRFSDLLTIEKEMGRRLRGINMAALSSSGGNNLGDTFWLPFRETANYLGMKYLTDMHTLPEEDSSMRIDAFINKIESHKS